MFIIQIHNVYFIFKHRTNIPDPPIIIYCLPMKHRERVGNNAWKRGPRESTMSQCTTLFLSWKSRAFLVELKLVVNELLMPVLGAYDAFSLGWLILALKLVTSFKEDVSPLTNTCTRMRTRIACIIPIVWNKRK